MSPETGRVCGAIGCGDMGVLQIEHPDHGPRTVCRDHAADFEVVQSYV